MIEQRPTDETVYPVLIYYSFDSNIMQGQRFNKISLFNPLLTSPEFFPVIPLQN